MAKKFLKEKDIAKDTKGGMSGRSFAPNWDEQRNFYGVEAFQLISKRLKSNWENSAQEVNPKERIPLQQRIVEKYKEELRANLYNFIYKVEHLCNTDKQMGLDDYYGELVPEIERLFDEGKDEQSLWHMSIDVMHDLLNNFYANFHDLILIFREFEKEKFFRSVRVVKELDETGHYTKDFLHNFYNLYCGKLAFRVCRFVYEWYFDYLCINDPVYVDEGKIPILTGLSGREIATYAEVACLYIALRNEQNKLKEEAELYGIPFEKPEKPKQEQQTEQEDNRWDTTRARKHFKKAIKAGLMEQTEDGHYRWKRSKKNPKAALGYFLQKVYNPDGFQQIPNKSLEKLFGEKRLDSTIGSVDFNKKDQPWKEPIDDLFDD